MALWSFDHIGLLNSLNMEVSEKSDILSPYKKISSAQGSGGGGLVITIKVSNIFVYASFLVGTMVLNLKESLVFSIFIIPHKRLKVNDFKGLFTIKLQFI
jgi:hypothetical protein